MGEMRASKPPETSQFPYNAPWPYCAMVVPFMTRKLGSDAADAAPGVAQDAARLLQHLESVLAEEAR